MCTEEAILIDIFPKASNYSDFWREHYRNLGRRRVQSLLPQNISSCAFLTEALVRICSFRSEWHALRYLLAQEWRGTKSQSSKEVQKAARPATETAADFAAESYLIFRSEIRQTDQESLLFSTPHSPERWWWSNDLGTMLRQNIPRNFDRKSVSARHVFCYSVKSANWLKLIEISGKQNLFGKVFSPEVI